MDEPRTPADKLAGIEGADTAALGAEPPPQSAPEAAEVDGEETLVPGATFGDRLPVDDKPWFTSLAFESDQSGVANEGDPSEDG
ncbi:MAG: hypothetical protein M3Y29_00080 [Chloroflexota bacterium]|jgi:hypothetical protein|nr:hypothetical protein [Chloroflexota bacterium]